jgi:23S rRNA (pseudouridine1915-N3)-methyltransferase
VVRLSSLVLNHDLARVVLVEQLYRAHTLLHNVPYHH